MPVLLKLRLPHSTDFGNAKPSTLGSRAPKPVTLAPSAENVDFVVIQTHLWFLIGRKTIKRFTSIRLPADGDLSHLECDVAAMADGLRADFDELLFQGRQRPVLTWGGPGQGVRFSRA